MTKPTPTKKRTIQSPNLHLYGKCYQTTSDRNAREIHQAIMTVSKCIYCRRPIIIYRPGARGIRWSITRSDDISRGALPRGKYHC
jgi:hypothetical protein